MAEIRQSGELTFPAADLTYQDETDCAANQAVDQLLPADGRALPSFFIIGPPRTGSSWLHEILKPHTLLPRYSKETRFFDTHFHRGLKWYLAHYENSIGKRRVGEVAPTYFASALARERMAQIVPKAKIICVFRNPVARILSLYRLKRAYGLIRGSFEQAVERDPELVESSNYAGNLKLWQQSFGVGNVLAGIYDDLLEKPQSFADTLVDFIGVSRFELEASQYKMVHDSRDMTHPRSYYRTRSAMMIAEWFRARRMDRVVLAFNRSPLRKLVLGGGPSFQQIPAEVSRRLYEKFRPVVEELEVLLNRDLSSWKFQSAK